MENTINIEPQQGSQFLIVSSKCFDDSKLVCCIPEAIGPTNEEIPICNNQPGFWTPTWKKGEDGCWTYSWKSPILEYSICAFAKDNYVDIKMSLKNLMNIQWQDSHSFSCINPRDWPIFADFEGTRTFLLFEDKWKSILEIERKDSGRPTIQLWYLKDKPRPLDFVEQFQATGPVYPEGVLAVRSRCGRHLIAVTADKPLYLFSNLEFSCIHCCPTFGKLAPGEEGQAFHRIFICKNTTLEQLKVKLKNTWK